MAWSNPHPAARGAIGRGPVGRRVVLVLDCLEDRYAPATIALFGLAPSSIVSTSPIVELDASAVGRFAVTAPLPAVAFAAASMRSDDVPFGFFHPFSQNGFGGGDMILEEPPLPMPRPVMPPPLDAAQILPDPEWPELPVPIAPLADGETPAPMLETPPAVQRPAEPETNIVTRAQTPPPILADEPAPVVSEISIPVMPAAGGSRKGFAAIGGIMAAASLLCSRNIRERRYDDAVAYSI